MHGTDQQVTDPRGMAGRVRHTYDVSEGSGVLDHLTEALAGTRPVALDDAPPD